MVGQEEFGARLPQQRVHSVGALCVFRSGSICLEGDRKRSSCPHAETLRKHMLGGGQEQKFMSSRRDTQEAYTWRGTGTEVHVPT
eukprot:1161623-Pelagomonas_calceolata.AAC.16